MILSILPDAAHGHVHDAVEEGGSFDTSPLASADEACFASAEYASIQASLLLSVVFFSMTTLVGG